MSLIWSLIFLISSAVSAAASGGVGFTVDMIHLDSPKSPLYNPSETHYHRLAKTLRRGSIRHAKAALTDTAEAPLFGNGGSYLMKLSLGTPPFPIMAIADTGSDVIWTQCQPCPNCYQQNAPMFNPSKSTTYMKIPCSSPLCAFGGKDNACPSSGESYCGYMVSYGDSSVTEGDLAVDVVTLGSTSGRPWAFSRTVIGCGYDNGGTFNANVSGIVGLGHGSASLVSQMGPAVDGRFSYCLTPFGSKKVTKLSFGSSAEVSGDGVVSTPIYFSASRSTFYSLNLQAVTVGDKRIDFPSSSDLAKGSNIIIDSGTTLTLFPPAFYSTFSTAIVDSMTLQPATDPHKFLQNCFETRTDAFEAPLITVNFEGADVSLGRENMFVRVADDIVCLAFGATGDDGISIYGNIAESNFLVGYDIKNLSVSFKRTDCAST